MREKSNYRGENIMTKENEKLMLGLLKEIEEIQDIRNYLEIAITKIEELGLKDGYRNDRNNVLTRIELRKLSISLTEKQIGLVREAKEL